MKCIPAFEKITDTRDVDHLERKESVAQCANTYGQKMLSFHQMIGNQAFGRMIQAKLKVGAPNDEYEHEADRIADLVMRMPEPGLQRQST